MFEESLLRNDKAICIIKEHLAPEQIALIENLTDSKAVWKALEDAHKGTSTGLNAFYTKCGMMDKRYNDGDNMQGHINFFILENKKLSTSDAFSDEFLAQLMLMSLPRNDSTWETFTIVTLSAITATNKLSTTFLSTWLMEEYNWLTSPNSIESANIAQSGKRQKPNQKKSKKDWCGYCHKGLHAEKDCRKKKADHQEKAPVPQASGRSRHAATANAASHSDSKSDSDNESPQANIASVFSEFPDHSHGNSSIHVFLSSSTIAFLAKSNNEESYIDSGCSCHISPCHKWFVDSSYTKLDSPIPTHLGDASTIMATHKVSKLKVDSTAYKHIP
ncbi:hypothetical protein GYMLUDRAFT_1000242 [Collybiopsis luxurians FD-317 M1]|uniref:Uncharacterized protein n=1 Tax=Collybiopsis luxurians FD-317 M1 TaxID=944289 RepID=A0A0D0CW10_9AGAR|nr:hypothetical protein GYMLUDRAFT_1000242 [Collybiopsis luxurians FD-317 M1]